MTMPPIVVLDLFPEIDRHLVQLLRSLSSTDWQRPTVSSRRTVKDIASHLLDGTLRRLSMQRDGYRPADGRSQPRPDEPLMDFLNRLNAEWETGTRRLSPQVLTDMLEWSSSQLVDLFRSLDPHAPAIFPVAWAGAEQSENWMDLAREYTEKWHHTEQIFDATQRPSTIMNPQLGYPCFDIFMRALPFTFRNVDAVEGRIVTVTITGEAGGQWHIRRERDAWQQIADSPRLASSTVTMDQDTAWKLVTKRRSRDLARQQFPGICIRGDEALGQHVFDMVSVMA